MPGGDEARVNFLTTTLGLQLVGRAGLTPLQQSLVKVSSRKPTMEDCCTSHRFRVMDPEIGRLCMHSKHILSWQPSSG